MPSFRIPGWCFCTPDAPVYFPGAAFSLAAIMNAAGIALLYAKVTNERRSSLSPVTP
jgi:hypothetical protein